MIRSATMIDRTFLSLTSAEWAAIASVVVAVATVALVIVTARYVKLTRQLVATMQAQVDVELEATLSGYRWINHPEGDIGPFPKLLAIINVGATVFVHRVEYDGTRHVPTEESTGGMRGDVDFLDPKTPPVRLSRGEVLYCGWKEGTWALTNPEQEVAITIEYSLEPRGQQPAYTRRVRMSEATDLPWGG